MTDQGATAAAASFVATADLAPWRSEVDGAVARAMVDTVGVAVAARHESSVQAVRRFAGAGELLGRSSPTGADRAATALVLGTAAHALDFDDYHPHLGHPSAVLVPALLAAAPEGCSGSAITDAYAVGYEVWQRIGRHHEAHYERGFHTTATVGTIGAASAVARLLGLDQVRTAQALGVAASLAGGLRSGFGTDVKGLHAGMAASAAVQAVTLVAHGLAGPAATMDVTAGFLDAFYEPGPASAVRDDLHELGTPPASLALLESPPIPKPYPSCGCAHSSIDAALALRAELPDEGATSIESVVVTTPSILYAEALQYADPRTGLQGKFSMEYCVARALVSGDVSVHRFDDAAVLDEDVRRLMERVSVRRDASLDVHMTRHGRLPARVAVATQERRRELEVVDPLGGPTNPMDDATVLTKFCQNAGEACASEAIDGVTSAFPEPDRLVPQLRSISAHCLAT